MFSEPRPRQQRGGPVADLLVSPLGEEQGPTEAHGLHLPTRINGPVSADRAALHLRHVERARLDGGEAKVPGQIRLDPKPETVLHVSHANAHLPGPRHCRQLRVTGDAVWRELDLDPGEALA